MNDTSFRGRRFAVLASRQQITWPDGTALALHPVQVNGVDSLFFRAVTTPQGLRILFDLRKVCPPLTEDLPVAPSRDVPGIVFFTLRHRFPNAAHLLLGVTQHAEGSWLPFDARVAA